MYEHWARDDVVAEYASFDFLLGAEQAILEEVRPHLASMRMLDIGVGGGRTTRHFVGLVDEYVGIDYSPKMIEACSTRFAGQRPDRISFRVMDARDMRLLESESFDFVLFSFNGLDLVGGQLDRLRALREIHRVSREGAMFCFSSHNMDFAREAFSVTSSIRRLLQSQPGRQHPSLLLRRRRLLIDAVVRPLRWRRLNPSRASLIRAGQGVVVEERHRYELTRSFYRQPNEEVRTRMYYIRPQEQISKLREVGFDGLRVFAPDGTEMTDRARSGLAEHWWLYYLGVRAAARA